MMKEIRAEGDAMQTGLLELMKRAEVLEGQCGPTAGSQRFGEARIADFRSIYLAIGVSWHSAFLSRKGAKSQRGRSGRNKSIAGMIGGVIHSSRNV